MAKLVWFIPGFMGATLGLYRSSFGQRVGPRISALWGDVASIGNLPIIDLLRMPNTLPQDQGIFADGIVDLAGQGYGGFMTWLRQNLPSDMTLAPWPFDWRKSARDTGDALAVALAGSASDGNTNYVLAHSQGALTAWVAWATLAEAGTTAAITKLVTFGGALYGTQSTPNFFREQEDSLALIARLKLAVGAGIGSAALNFPPLAIVIGLQSGSYVNDGHIRELISMAGTWPGIYDLYPDAARLDNPDDSQRPLLFDSTAWSAALSPPNFTLMATEVARVHTWLRTPLHLPPYDRVAHIVGGGISTPTITRRSSLASDQQGTLALIAQAGVNTKTARLLQLPQFGVSTDGDGRCTTAQQALPDRYWQRVTSAHTDQQNSAAVRALVLAMLTTPNPTIGVPNPVSVALHSPPVYPAAHTGLGADAFTTNPMVTAPAPQPLPGSGVAGAPLILGGDP